MDWLLKGTMPPQMAQGQSGTKASTSAFESIAQSLVFRESKNPGRGVRLFIQACCLAGCDYSHSLNGIGLVTAFKMVRDNAAFDDVFKGVLSSLPKKAKKDE